MHVVISTPPPTRSYPAKTASNRAPTTSNKYLTSVGSPLAYSDDVAIIKEISMHLGKNIIVSLREGT